MVSAAKTNGVTPPMNRPIVTGTSLMLRLPSGPPSRPAANEKALNNARAVMAAEPIAKPLATAAVVLPSESRASVTSRTSGGSSAISAIPPALSAIGP